MKKAATLFLLLFLSANLYAQNVETLKSYGRELFTHFVARDFSWIDNQMTGKQYSKSFRANLEKTYTEQTREEGNFPWLNLMVDKVEIRTSAQLNFTELRLHFYHDGLPYVWQISNIYYDENLKHYRIGTPTVRVFCLYVPLERSCEENR